MTTYNIKTTICYGITIIFIALPLVILAAIVELLYNLCDNEEV